MTERVATSNQNQINQVKNQNVFNSEFSKFSNLLNTLKLQKMQRLVEGATRFCLKIRDFQGKMVKTTQLYSTELRSGNVPVVAE